MFKDLFSYAQIHQRPRDDVVFRVCVNWLPHTRVVSELIICNAFVGMMLIRCCEAPFLLLAHTHDVCSPECLMHASGVSVVDEGYIPRLLMK